MSVGRRALDRQVEGLAGSAQRPHRDAQAGLAADGVIEALAEGDALARGAQGLAGAVADEQLVAELAVAGGPMLTVPSKGVRDSWTTAPFAGGTRPDSVKLVAPSQGRRVSSRSACSEAGVGCSAGDQRPLDRSFREAVEGEALGKGLAGVLVVVVALVAGKRRPVRLPWQTFSSAGPALRPPVDRGRKGDGMSRCWATWWPYSWASTKSRLAPSPAGVVVAADDDLVFAARSSRPGRRSRSRSRARTGCRAGP